MRSEFSLKHTTVVVTSYTGNRAVVCVSMYDVITFRGLVASTIVCKVASYD